MQFQFPITNVDDAYRFILSDKISPYTKFPIEFQLLLVQIWENSIDNDLKKQSYDQLLYDLITVQHKTDDSTIELTDLTNEVLDVDPTDYPTVISSFNHRHSIFQWDLYIRSCSKQPLNSLYQDQYPTVYHVIFKLLKDNVDRLINDYKFDQYYGLQPTFDPFEFCNNYLSLKNEDLIFKLSS